MGKAALTPLYISVAWVLMVSYQLFTETAVVAVVKAINTFLPSAMSMWLASRVETLVFIHAFAWVFLLSSAIPSILLRRGSVLTQFSVCLTLALVSIWVRDNLPYVMGGQVVERILSLAGLFNNPLFAGLFLTAPYLLMLSIDVYSRLGNRGL